MVEYYKSKRFVDGLKWVIVDETGKVVNNSPSKEELKELKIFYKNGKSELRNRVYTDEQLLWHLIQFYQKYGRPPTQRDFTNNPEYPNYQVYIKRFKSWSNALKLVGLDVESMVKKGVLDTTQQIGRFGEIIIRDHFENNPVDLAGENCTNPYDGICPNGKIYDVKSSGLHYDTQYLFRTNNKYKDEIEIYYLLGFNRDYTKLNYGWRIPGEIVEKDNFIVGLKSRAKFTVRNMKEYDITEELREVLNKYDFFEANKDKEKTGEKLCQLK